MIHDDMSRHFRGQQRPELSADFAANLRRRVRSVDRPSAVTLAASRWLARLYWLGAAALLAAYLPTVALTPMQIASFAAVASIVMRAAQRVLRVPPLVRTLREAVRR